jgi:hypothetical protein
MAKFQNSLGHMKIAAPCSADWDQMFSFEGERRSACSQKASCPGNSSAARDAVEFTGRAWFI